MASFEKAFKLASSCLWTSGWTLDLFCAVGAAEAVASVECSLVRSDFRAGRHKSVRWEGA